MRLADGLNAQNGRPLLVGAETSLGGREICDAVPGDLWRQAAASGGLALYLRNPLKLAAALTALDGHAERMLLISHDQRADVVLRLAAQAECGAILSDLALPALPPGMVALPWAGPLRPLAGAWNPGPRDTSWLLTTSGTTGLPKIVSHSLASLTRKTRLRPATARRWGQVYSIGRFAGLQVLLQAMLSGGTLILPDLEASLGAQIDMLAGHGCDALSATPTLWRKILMLPQADTLGLAQVTLGGEIADDTVLTALARRFPAAHVTHIYASTEAGVGFSVHDGRAGFPASYLDGGTGGIRLRLQDGRLWVENPLVEGRYLTGEAFRDTAGYVDTGDVVEVRGDRCVFLGRDNGSINVGGNKVFPEEVEAVLCAHPDVRLARVSGKPSPIVGALVTAEVVAVTGAATDLPARLRQWCATRLERWKCPALITIVDDIALGSGAKVNRSRP